MTIDLLGIYEARVNGMNVKLVRNDDDLSKAQLYIDNEYKGVAPYYYTIKRIVEMEDNSYPVYKLEGVKRVNLRAIWL
ncbi:hypothetical protein [Peribacillus asahii]|uniref:hypothetical protein n=1 Tax=Peribacillus asahii TaxID=228899 RepID=UPI0037F1ED3E